MLLMTLIPLVLASQSLTYQGVLDRYVGAGTVDYAGIAAAGALDGVIMGLETATAPAEKSAKMAFWINAYNALTVDLIADNLPLTSIRDLDGGNPWDARHFTVAGQDVTLNHIEHKILRPLGDPRIHAAVNCASRGCPPLSKTAFTAAGLDAELDAASLAWVSGNGLSIAADGSVQLNQIFDWYGDDFKADRDIPGVDGKAEAAICFAIGYLPAHAETLAAGNYAVSHSTYDWSLNSR